jgi:hypothetical protein
LVSACWILSWTEARASDRVFFSRRRVSSCCRSVTTRVLACVRLTVSATSPQYRYRQLTESYTGPSQPGTDFSPPPGSSSSGPLLPSAPLQYA